jgi:hypothetical protein
MTFYSILLKTWRQSRVPSFRYAGSWFPLCGFLVLGFRHAGSWFLVLGSWFLVEQPGKAVESQLKANKGKQRQIVREQ